MIDKKTRSRVGEQGNVLFLILIAVALFAALSYAVTQSTRSGGGDASDEGNLVSSAQITQYPASVRTSIVRMIIGGADVSTLEFNAPAQFDNCTEINGRKVRCVFHPDGGGATHQNAPGEVMASGASGAWTFNAQNEIDLIGRTGASGPTEETADLIAFLPGITNGICSRINQQLGITGAIAQTGIDYSSGMINDTGSADTAICDGSCNAASTIDGTFSSQPFGCFSQDDQNVYYHVLIER